MEHMFKIVKRYILAKSAQAMAEAELAHVHAELAHVHVESKTAHAHAMEQLAQQLIEQLKLFMSRPAHAPPQ